MEEAMRILACVVHEAKRAAFGHVEEITKKVTYILLAFKTISMCS